MYAKTIRFKDYEGVEREETHYFHLNKAELIEWVTMNGDYSLEAVLNKMIEKKNGKEIIAAMKDLIYRSYGEKSLDGRRFIKNEKVKEEFMESEAYSELFVELVTNAEEAAKFYNGIIPSEIADEIQKTLKENPAAVPESARPYLLGTSE